MIQFGNWTYYKDGDEEGAKERLKKEMHDLIDTLCEKDDFWIKVERDKSGKDILRNENTLAWKIAIPQMKNGD